MSPLKGNTTLTPGNVRLFRDFFLKKCEVHIEKIYSKVLYMYQYKKVYLTQYIKNIGLTDDEREHCCGRDKTHRRF